MTPPSPPSPDHASNDKRAHDLSDLDTLLAETSFRVDGVASAKIGPSWVPTRHRAAWDKLYVVERGHGTMWLGREEYRMRSGEAYLFGAETLQRGEVDALDPMHKYWVHFHAFTTQTLQLLSLYPPPRALIGPTAAKIHALTVEMHEEWRNPSPARQLAVKSLLMRVLVLAYRAPEEDRRGPDRVHGDEATAQSEDKNHHDGHAALPIREVLALISRRYAEPLALADLAACAHLHPTHFNKVFKRYVGMPPMKYLEQQRLRRAQELLGATTRSVADIARSVGYQDPYYFSRAFRRMTGMTPTSYRDEAQKMRSRTG